MKQARINITKFFTQPSLINIIITLVVGAILWFVFGQRNGINESHPEVVSTMFMKHFAIWTLPTWVGNILGFIAMVGIMSWGVVVCEKLQIIPVRTTMVFTVGLIMSSAIGYIQPFDESYIAIILFIFALRELIQMYHFENQMAAGFNIVLWLSLATLFEPEYIWLSLLFVLGMTIFRVITGRVFLSILFAISTIVILLGSIFWLFDSLDILLKYLENTISFKLLNFTTLDKFDIIIFGFIILLELFTFVNYYLNSNNYKLNTRLNFSLINAGFWVSLIWVILLSSNFTQLIAVPGLFAIMCISLYFSTNQSKVANILFVLWFLIFVGYRIASSMYY